MKRLAIAAFAVVVMVPAISFAQTTSSDNMLNACSFGDSQNPSITELQSCVSTLTQILTMLVSQIANLHVQPPVVSTTTIPIATPTITVFSPNGGEQWSQGTTQSIQWSSVGLGKVSNVMISLVPANQGDNIVMNERTIANNATNSGSWAWTIPNCYAGHECSSNFEIPVGSYFIAVTDPISGSYDMSNAPFSIVSSGTATVPTISSITPNVAVARSAALVQPITIYGSNFTPDSVVNFNLNGQPSGSIYGSSLTVTSNQINFNLGLFGANSSAGNYQVAVTNSVGTSNAVGFTLTASSTSSSPVITGVSGPQSLNVNQQGTWSVAAYDVNGRNLSYSVNWGDYSQGYAGISAQGMPSTQNSTFTHSYSQAGIYTPTFTVTSQNTIECVKAPCPSNGGSAQTSLSVNVGGKVTNSSPVINGIPAIPASVQVGQSVSFGWHATDANNDDLSWSVDFGDSGVATPCAANPTNGAGQNWSYNTGHAWTNPGTYTVKATVYDCKDGTDSNSFTVNVGGTSSTAVVATTTYNASYDYNNDGAIDQGDYGILSFVANNLRTCPAGKICDMNNDGKVDIQDIIQFKTMFNIQSATTMSQAQNLSQTADILQSMQGILQAIGKILP